MPFSTPQISETSPDKKSAETIEEVSDDLSFSLPESINRPASTALERSQERELERSVEAKDAEWTYQRKVYVRGKSVLGGLIAHIKLLASQYGAYEGAVRELGEKLRTLKNACAKDAPGIIDSVRDDIQKMGIPNLEWKDEAGSDSGDDLLGENQPPCSEEESIGRRIIFVEQLKAGGIDNEILKALAAKLEPMERTALAGEVKYDGKPDSFRRHLNRLPEKYSKKFEIDCKSKENHVSFKITGQGDKQAAFDVSKTS